MYYALSSLLCRCLSPAVSEFALPASGLLGHVHLKDTSYVHIGIVDAQGWLKTSAVDFLVAVALSRVQRQSLLMLCMGICGRDGQQEVWEEQVLSRPPLALFVNASLS